MCISCIKKFRLLSNSKNFQELLTRITLCNNFNSGKYKVTILLFRFFQISYNSMPLKHSEGMLCCIFVRYLSSIFAFHYHNTTIHGITFTSRHFYKSKIICCNLQTKMILKIHKIHHGNYHTSICVLEA